MNDSLKLILDLFAISGCIWLLFGLYRDIKEANYVTRHFSLKEIRQAKWFVLIGLIVTIHITAYYILKSISPAAFN